MPYFRCHSGEKKTKPCQRAQTEDKFHDVTSHLSKSLKLLNYSSRIVFNESRLLPRQLACIRVGMGFDILFLIILSAMLYRSLLLPGVHITGDWPYF
jgi:hypothetical protein